MPIHADGHRYTLGEEIANTITHGAGLVLSGVALTLMVVFSTLSDDPWRVFAVSVFGVTLIIMYLASTLYHGLPPYPRLKTFLRTFDHCAIYLLIAGTYTPFLLVSLRGTWGWTLFGLIWGIAVVGCAYKILSTGHSDKISTFLYVAMGWFVLIALKPTIEAVPAGALILMAIGGLLYTGGVVFYLWNRLPYNHAIWHVFVLGGSTAHFFAVFFFIAWAPAAAV